MLLLNEYEFSPFFTAKRFNNIARGKRRSRATPGNRPIEWTEPCMGSTMNAVLYNPYRVDVGSSPVTQGGAPRLRRSADPRLSCLTPLG